MGELRDRFRFLTQPKLSGAAIPVLQAAANDALLGWPQVMTPGSAKAYGSMSAGFANYGARSEPAFCSAPVRARQREDGHRQGSRRGRPDFSAQEKWRKESGLEDRGESGQRRRIENGGAAVHRGQPWTGVVSALLKG